MNVSCKHLSYLLATICVRELDQRRYSLPQALRLYHLKAWNVRAGSGQDEEWWSYLYFDFALWVALDSIFCVTAADELPAIHSPMVIPDREQSHIDNVQYSIVKALKQQASNKNRQICVNRRCMPSIPRYLRAGGPHNGQNEMRIWVR